MEFYIAQAIGLCITVMSMVVQHFKKMHWIVAMEALMNGLAAVQYFLLDGMSGMWVSLIASANAICMMGYVKFGNQESRKIPNILCVVFAAAHIAMGVQNIHRWYDVIPVAAAIVFTVSMVQPSPFFYRICRIFNGGIWTVYCVCAGAYTMILTQVLGMVSAGTAIWRLDIKKKEKDTI